MFLLQISTQLVVCFTILSAFDVSAFNTFATSNKVARSHNALPNSLKLQKLHSSKLSHSIRQTQLRLKTEPTEEEAIQNEIDDNLLIERLNAEIFAESGVELDQLINPSKVVNLERDLVSLRKDILLTTDVDEIAEINKIIDKKTATLIVEKRGVMRGWLKNLFVGQSVLAGAGSLALVYQVVPTELPIQVLGFWMWWLFIIPSLRYVALYYQCYCVLPFNIYGTLLGTSSLLVERF
jgi:hypothetical protein